MTLQGSIRFPSSSFASSLFPIRLVSRGRLESTLSSSDGKQRERERESKCAEDQGEREKGESETISSPPPMAFASLLVERSPAFSSGKGMRAEQCAIALSAARSLLRATAGLHGDGERRRSPPGSRACVPVFFLREEARKRSERVAGANSSHRQNSPLCFFLSFVMPRSRGPPLLAPLLLLLFSLAAAAAAAAASSSSSSSEQLDAPPAANSGPGRWTLWGKRLPDHDDDKS